MFERIFMRGLFRAIFFNKISLGLLAHNVTLKRIISQMETQCFLLDTN